jgi:hypothetical protein
VAFPRGESACITNRGLNSPVHAVPSWATAPCRGVLLGGARSSNQIDGTVNIETPNGAKIAMVQTL